MVFRHRLADHVRGLLNFARIHHAMSHRPQHAGDARLHTVAHIGQRTRHNTDIA